MQDVCLKHQDVFFLWKIEVMRMPKCLIRKNTHKANIVTGIVAIFQNIALVL